MHDHPQTVCCVAQRGHFIGGVDGAQFGALGDGDDAGLGVMHIALEAGQRIDLVRVQLGVRGLEWHDLGAKGPLGGTGLIDGDVRPLRACDEVRGLDHRCGNA